MKTVRDFIDFAYSPFPEALEPLSVVVKIAKNLITNCLMLQSFFYPHLFG